MALDDNDENRFQLKTSQAANSISLTGNSIEFWKDQIRYTDKSSTLNKQLRVVSTASALLATAVSMPALLVLLADKYYIGR